MVKHAIAWSILEKTSVADYKSDSDGLDLNRQTITGDNDIPINKRGSGIRRLILINFFRAEAERRIREMNAPSIIYAIEEPETSQHAEHQKN